MNKTRYAHVDTLPIRLGQFLKFVNAVGDGMEAKQRIQAGQVSVNDAIEIRRGRQLQAGDKVTIDDMEWEIAPVD